MEPTRKPRSDSRLKVLPEDRQAAIAEMLRSKSLDEVRRELRADGIETSMAALSEFWSWWQVRESLRRREARVGAIIEQVHCEQPEIDADHLFRLGQSVFGALSIAEEDSAAWYRTQRLAIARDSLEVERRRVALLEQKLRQVQDAVTQARDGGLTPETLARIEEAARLL